MNCSSVIVSGGMCGTVREPGAALLPPDDREIVLEARGIALRQKIFRQTAVEIEQHRMCRVFAQDEHPLPHAVDLHAYLLGNAAEQWAAVHVSERDGCAATQRCIRRSSRAARMVLPAIKEILRNMGDSSCSRLAGALTGPGDHPDRRLRYFRIRALAGQGPTARGRSRCGGARCVGSRGVRRRSGGRSQHPGDDRPRASPRSMAVGCSAADAFGGCACAGAGAYSAPQREISPPGSQRIAHEFTDPPAVRRRGTRTASTVIAR